MYFEEQEANTLYFLSMAYKETDISKMYVNHEHLCSMRHTHFQCQCFLFGVCERYHASVTRNLKYNYNKKCILTNLPPRQLELLSQKHYNNRYTNQPCYHVCYGLGDLDTFQPPDACSNEQSRHKGQARTKQRKE